VGINPRLFLVLFIFIAIITNKADAMISFPFEKPLDYLIKSAVSGCYYLMLDLETDLSRKVYASQCINLDEIEALRNKLKDLSGVSSVDITEQELVLIYTCNYISNCSSSDKENFYKWFLKFDTGEIKDSDDFRKVNVNYHKACCLLIEQHYADFPSLAAKKKVLEKIFGELKEEN
jgi:hypothetical protein